MEGRKPNKQLSKKRFITMALLMTFGVVLYMAKDYSMPMFKSMLFAFDAPARNFFVGFFGVITGVLHYFYITKDQQESKNIFVATSMGLVNSLGSSIGYSVIVNKGLNFAVGLAKDLFHIEQFFVNPDQVDHISLLVVTLVAVYIGGFYLLKMAGEFVIEIVNPTATPSGDTEKNKTEVK